MKKNNLRVCANCRFRKRLGKAAYSEDAKVDGVEFVIVHSLDDEQSLLPGEVPTPIYFCAAKQRRAYRRISPTESIIGHYNLESYVRICIRREKDVHVDISAPIIPDLLYNCKHWKSVKSR